MSPRRGTEPPGDTLRMLQHGPVVVRRSARRTRTVAAFWEDGQAVVAIPAHFNGVQETEWVTRMVEKLHRQGQKGSAGKGSRRAPNDAALADHAAVLSKTYLGGRAVPSSVRWVRNQNSRWGSATPSEGTIRLSHKLQPMPQWVIDYVLLHELAHLLVAGHNAAFWRLLEAYPDTERAKAFLEGVSFATGRGLDRTAPEGGEPGELSPSGAPTEGTPGDGTCPAG